MGVGRLKAQVHTGEDALPVANANVQIKDKSGNVLYNLTTDASGNTEYVELPAPDKANTLDPNSPGPHYSTYDVVISHPDSYITDTIHGVQIFDGVSSTEQVNLVPKPRTRENFASDYFIPPNALETDSQSGPAAQSASQPIPRVLPEVAIPEYITVHLGTPGQTNARNVRVKFTDYIKNVASSEIYPTWPENAIRANIYAQISLALNRIYTEWYRGKGYNFDITNSTAYDQAFVENRNIFDNVSQTVDEIFNQYIRRTGRKEPFYAEYCSGTTVTCPGMSQWGTVSLANQGLDPLQILRNYYPKDIQIVTTNNIKDMPASYPGYTLTEGMTSEDIRRMQNFLNRIRANYPAIPQIANPNGYFGPDTTQAVKAFQQIFGLTPSGTVSSDTWYKISAIYLGVTKLAELTSEGERIGIGATPPTSVVSTGSKGADVVELQYLLNYISTFYPTIPSVIQDGTFGTTTKDAVTAFQRTFGLTPDGVVGPATWNRLYQVHNQIENEVEVPETTPVTPPPTTQPTENPPYPGYLLRVNSRGNAVLTMQKFLNSISDKYPSIPKLSEDGIFGPGTQAAVIAFQRQFGLGADGIIGPSTWNKVVEVYNSSKVPEKPEYPGYLLRVGSRGDAVLTMQKYLNLISNNFPNIPKVSEDGIFGPGTQAAVIEFQKQFGLGADGIIGPGTWNMVIDVADTL